MATPVDALEAGMFGACPVPQSRYDRILLGHGSGGQLTADLTQRLFVPAFDNEVLAALKDQATLDCGLRIADCGLTEKAKRNGRRQEGLQSAIRNPQSAIQGRIAFTTDSFVVRPIFFPGGDIG